MNPGPPPAVSPGLAAPERVGVINSGEAGVSEHANLTLDSLKARPKLADGGAEAVVGAAHGEEPEVVATAAKPNDEEEEGSKGKLSWLKRLTPSISNSDKSDKSKSREDDATPPPTAVDPVAAVAPGATEVKEVEPTKVVTDNTGTPVPLEVGAPKDAPSSLGTSIKDELTDQYDLDPATSSAKFHSLFESLPAEEELIEDYRCALQRDILVQGRVYVTERHLLFRANIFGWETALSIPWTEVTTIEKRMTAKVIPNALEVSTLHSRHVFSSLLNRDSAYQLFVDVWRHNHPDEQRVRDRSESASTATTMDRNHDAKSEISFEGDDGQKKKHRFTGAIQAASNKLKSIRSKEEPDGDGKTEAQKVKEKALQGEPGHKPTEYDGEEYDNVALDVVLPTSPEKAYYLFFTDTEFLKPFLEDNQGLKELDMGEWATTEGDLQKREMSYIKPLNASMGPKQTKCNIIDENEHIDPEEYISNETTTRTPDVPSGSDFSVKTKSVFTWSELGGCHVRVTTEVAWTKTNRMLKGIIERSCIEGQKTFHADLEKAARAHIDSHKEDFADPGVTNTTDAPAKTTEEPAAEGGSLLDQLMSPSPLLFLAIGVAFLLLTNLFTLNALRVQARAAHEARLGHPSEVASAVGRVLEDFRSVHEKRGGAFKRDEEVAALVLMVRGLEKGLRDVTHRLEGLARGA